jgi:lipid-binding SYLF domain-containing protein
MKKIMLTGFVVSVALFLAVANGAWEPRDKAAAENKEVDETISRFLKEDPSLKTFFDKAYGYVVFPTVGKGAYIVGVGFGRGLFFENAKPIGRATIAQVSAGAQIGGQAFSEIIFFRDKELVREFKKGQFELSAQISAVAVKEVGQVSYTNGTLFSFCPRGSRRGKYRWQGSFRPFRNKKSPDEIS